MEKLTINITSGECLNAILENKYKNKIFIPFNEAMIKGSFESKLFSEDFIKERAACHEVTVDEYKEKLTKFLTLLTHLEEYEKIQLFFGDEPFCLENKKIIIKTLRLYGYNGLIISSTVNELTGEVLYEEIYE